MVNLHHPRFQLVPLAKFLNLLFLISFSCPDLWAAGQDAMVVAEKAVIYSDTEMTSPIGFVRKGKKVVVGEISRNKAQVYPIIVSGRIAYIRVLDVTTEKSGPDSTYLVAERFQQNTKPLPKSKYVFSYYSFMSNMSVSDVNYAAEDNQSFFWHGLSLKGEVLVKKRLDVQVVANYMFTDKEDQHFKVVEFGGGVAYRLIDKRRFLLRAEGQFLFVPFSMFSYRDDFRVKSYGYSFGAGLNMTYLFDSHWGLEGFGGLYRTSLLKFDSPSPYRDFGATFTGGRFGIGLNYTY
jgi:hypothetical protein